MIEISIAALGLVIAIESLAIVYSLKIISDNIEKLTEVLSSSNRKTEEETP